MRQNSPERSASRRHFNPSQASTWSYAKRFVQTGTNADDILLSKASRSSNSRVSACGASHPRFRGNEISSHLRKKLARVPSPCIRWTCPPKFILNDKWHVAAGEQSEERRVQSLREPTVSDLIHSHPSTLPSCILRPLNSLNVDEHSVPIIPITPIEEGEVEPLSPAQETVNTEVLLQPKTGLEADIGAAAYAALTALVNSSEQGSLIETDLLIKILTDPKIVELLKGEGQMVVPSLEDGEIPSVPPPCLVPDMMLLLKQVCENQEKILKQAQTTSEPPSPQKLETELRSHLTTSRPQQPSFLSEETIQPIRDVCYYKSLVRQHGVERQEVDQGRKLDRSQLDTRIGLGAHGNVSARPESDEHRQQKVCFYFNRPKGCRLGLSCPYRHDFSPARIQDQKVPEAPSAKRVKFTIQSPFRL